MEKKITKKIIAGVIVFVLVFSSILVTKQSQAATSSIGNYYSNPNQAYSNNQYKFKVSDVVNSSTLTAVVGCTGVVNKVATWMSRFIQSPLKLGEIAKDEIALKRKQLEDACSTSAAAAEAVGNSIPVIGGLAQSINKGLQKIPECRDRVKSLNDDEIRYLIKEEQATQARDSKEQCFDGIAITLAKNQLTAMTRSAMNWANTGFGGNPFFVQNAQNLIGNISENVLQTGIETLLAPSNPNPYARDFANAAVAQRGIVSSSAGLLGSLTSDLENFVSDPRTYYTDEQLDRASNSYIAESTAYNAKLATESFANNFSLGGWNAWLALTQREKNNPLGFNMLANQYISEMQTAKITETKEELAQNDGFMSQKVCDQWQMYYGSNTENPANKYKPINANMDKSSDLFLPTLVKDSNVNQDQTNGRDYGVCFRWKTITPGSLIKDKVANYLNSPERQLEMVKTINDSLNALFSVLINKLQGGGLSSLSDASVTTNWTDNINSLRGNSGAGDDSSGGYDNGGAYSEFNLTRDLGNTYIHETPTEIGTWDAQLNLTSMKNPKDGLAEKLYPDIAPIEYNGFDKEGNVITAIRSNVYYEVVVPGKTKLITDGYNSWQKGDRAFWDGEKWQNWKAKAGQQSPIKRRGVIQIQQDYVVAAKEVLKVLPGVMPALGKLDYCLPGPNPNYKINSSNAQSAFSSWIGSTYVGMTDSSGERFGVKIDTEGQQTYDELENIYPDKNIWNFVTKEKVGNISFEGKTVDFTMENVINIFSNICNDTARDTLDGLGKTDLITNKDLIKFVVNPWYGVSSYVKRIFFGEPCKGNYTYAKNGDLGEKQAANIDFKTRIQEYLLNYVNNYLFINFYDTFDKQMDKIYFKNMTTKYIEHENQTLDITRDLNGAYVPMAQSGIDFIKNISIYDTDTKEAQDEYQNSMTTAKSNIARLEPIKAEVSKIITDAQNRRLNKLRDAIGKSLATPENYSKCTSSYDECITNRNDKEDNCYANKFTCINNTLTGNKIPSADIVKETYKSCLDEENVKFYDADSITGENETRNQEACSDGIDNDLDGLIDNKDTEDCGGTTENTNRRRLPIIKPNISSDSNSESSSQ